MTKRNNAGIYQKPNGFWEYRFTVVVDGKKISKKKGSDEFGNKLKTKSEAIKAREAAIYKARTEREQKRKIERKRMKEVYYEYCEKGRSGKAYATIKKQDSLWNNHIREKFGDSFIDEISVAEIEDFLSELYYIDGLAFRYVESFLKMFYLIFGQAYSRNYLDVDTYNKLCINKDTKIHMPKMKVDEDTDIIAFSRSEISMLEDYFTGTNAETAYMLGRYCGLRINECYGLKWDHIDIENGVIYIDRQMQYQDGLIKLVPLKTRNARRKIYMSERLKNYLAKLKLSVSEYAEKYKLQREQNKTIITDIDGSSISSLELVNSLSNGKIQTINSIKFHSQKIKAVCGIAFKYHYLRHTYGTQLAELNTPLHILCNQMGHGNSQVTQKYYLAISDQGISKLLSNLENI